MNRVRTSATPASALASRENEVASGESLLESFAFFDRDSLSLKMSQRSLFGGWTEFSETLPRSGTMRSGRLFVHPTWAPLIDANESSSSRGDEEERWPTPTTLNTTSQKAQTGRPTSGPSRGGPSYGLEDVVKQWPTPMSYGHGEDSNAPGQTKLDIVVLGRYQDNPRYWPTATAGDSKSSGSRNLEGSKAHPGVSLTDAVTTGGSTEPRRWPTPRAHDADSPGGFDTVSNGGGPSLPTAVRQASMWPTPEAADGSRGPALGAARAWPTPTVQDAENTAGPSQERRNTPPLNVQARWPTPSATPYGSSQNGINGKGGEFERPSAGTPSLETIAKAEGGKLNPAWVCCLMGFPSGWTEVDFRSSKKRRR